MNDYFAAFIRSARKLGESRGLQWNLRLEKDGRIRSDQVWDLSALVCAAPPRALFSDLGEDERCLAHLRSAEDSLSPTRAKAPLSKGWQDLLKAVAIDQILVRRNRPLSAANGVLRPLRVLATIAAGTEPWDLTREIAERACTLATEVQPCGALGSLVAGVLRDVIDRNHLAHRCPLVPPSLSRRRRARSTGADDSPALRKRLADRKDADRLPNSRALWELVRIVLTETPRTYMDVIRFAQILIQLLCGFRIGEGILVPADWRREREYLDTSGRPAGEAGGISRSLGIRHFAEKQRGLTADSVALFEQIQHVPAMFEEALVPALDNVGRITKPLRDRLRAQTETGRLFPEYEASDLMPAVEFFVRLFGSLEMKEEELPADLLARYRSTWDPSLLDGLRAAQTRSSAPLRIAIKSAWSRLNMRHPLPVALRSDGLPWRGRERVPWSRSYFRVADLEAYVPGAVPTKLPDRTPLRLSDGTAVFPHELLFLGPKRVLIEERNDGLCDLGLYFSVGAPDQKDLALHLGGRDEANIFTRYGATDEDRALSINSHSLRHLQTTELYRLGISELAITKRFNRRTIVESRKYQHLTLAQDLDAIDLPADAEQHLGPQARDVFRLIAAGKLGGPIVEKFRRIQREDGEQAAIAFLEIEADGFHSTPYGYCLTSLLVNPCDKNTECFNGCRHLSLSPLDEHRLNLERMRDTLQAVVRRCQELPDGHLGREAQLQHARVRLSNVERALSMTPGSRPFPGGEDFSRPASGSFHG
jgi:hypothetical protein